MKKLVLSIVLLQLSACSCEPQTLPSQAVISVPNTSKMIIPSPPPAIADLNQKIVDTGETLLKKGQELGKNIVDTIQNPERPEREYKRPDLDIVSDPPTLLNLGSAVGPTSLLLEARILNAAESEPIATYAWSVKRKGIPFIREDTEIATGLSQRLNLVLSEPGVYLITATITTLSGETVSSSVRFWIRT